MPAENTQFTKRCKPNIEAPISQRHSKLVWDEQDGTQPAGAHRLLLTQECRRVVGYSVLDRAW